MIQKNKDVESMKEVDGMSDQEKRIKMLQDILTKSEPSEGPMDEAIENDEEQSIEDKNNIEAHGKPSLFKKHGINIIIALTGKKG